MHWSTLQWAAELQLGPPSVARMTDVLPGSEASVGKSAFSVAAVGVDPTGMVPVGRLMARAKAMATGFSSSHEPAGVGCPGVVGKTSSPARHA